MVNKTLIRVGRFWESATGFAKYSIANTQPRGFRLARLEWAIPQRRDVWAHKKGQISWEEFEQRYLEHLRSKWPVMKAWLMNVVSLQQNVLLCCWEKDGECHRYILARALMKAILALGLWKELAVVGWDRTPRPEELFSDREPPADRDSRSGLDDVGEPKEFVDAAREADADAYELELWQEEALYHQGLDITDEVDFSCIPFVKPGLHSPAEEMQMREDELRYCIPRWNGKVQVRRDRYPPGRWWASSVERTIELEMLAAWPNKFDVEFDPQAVRRLVN